MNIMKTKNQKAARITNYEVLDWFVQGLNPEVQHKVLKDNPVAFSDACILAERIGCFYNYLREKRGNGLYRYNKAENHPTGYTPMDLTAE